MNPAGTAAAGGAAPTGRKPLIEVRNDPAGYGNKRRKTPIALRDVSPDVLPCEFLAIVGPSGFGKPTFVNMFGSFVKLFGGFTSMRQAEP